MSKYIKLEDAIEQVNKPTQYIETCNVLDEVTKRLQSLPTIEASEGDLYIPLNNQTVERINRLHKDECGEYFDEEWLFNELEQISEFREISEDCISREWVKGICENMLDEEMLGHMLGYIEDAPSVVPRLDKEDLEDIKEHISESYIEGYMDGKAEGEWLLDGRCSNCLQAPLTTHKTYCPNCGAKMKV